DQRAFTIAGHAVGAVRVIDQQRHIVRFLEAQALDLHRWRVVGAPPRKGREVERVLIGEVHGALVGVHLGEQREPRLVADHIGESGPVRDESGIADDGVHDTRPRALSISHAAVISPMWLNACGKLPSSSPLEVSISSARSPRALAWETSRLNSASARSISPAFASADTSQNEQITNVPSSPVSPSAFLPSWLRYRSTRPSWVRSRAIASIVERIRASVAGRKPKIGISSWAASSSSESNDCA